MTTRRLRARLPGWSGLVPGGGRGLPGLLLLPGRVLTAAPAACPGSRWPWPGILVADRLDGLRGHPLAMGSERNRRIAVTALLGDERTDLDADLAITGMGVSPPLRLRHTARMMGAAGHGGQPGWLEVVLSWPGRLIGPVPPGPEAPPPRAGRGQGRDRIASGRDEH